MSYASLAQCVRDLYKNGDLRIVDTPLDPHLEIGMVQRRVFQNGGPALLFTRPKGCRFPMLANLFGSRSRIDYIFRDSINQIKDILTIFANPGSAIKSPLKTLKLAPRLKNLRPKWIARAPVLAEKCELSALPRLSSWPEDGGPFITLPLVYSAMPDEPAKGNLGMYRVQISGNAYAPDEVGLHYQIKRGIGVHHKAALAKGRRLPVNIHIGGPPCFTLAAVMPLPEGMCELLFAGLLGNRRPRLSKGAALPVLAEADFVIQGYLDSTIKPEGPFGDHLGYYSLRHDFPVLKITSIHHRKDAIWLFTTVGRPPQEDSMLGEVIHELASPLLNTVFPGLKEVNAVDAAGVHPLLLALAEERFTPYEPKLKPRELLTHAMHLLGNTQTSLAKFLLIAASSDRNDVSCRNPKNFLTHLLERVDFRQDLHFITPSICDTLDYSGYNLHEGSRLIITACNPKKRALATELDNFPDLPAGFKNPAICLPGILAIEAPLHTAAREDRDAMIENELCECLASWKQRDNFPLVVIVDDSAFCAASLDNFLWTVFTRTDPARDSYGVSSSTICKRWTCDAPLILDARLKSFQPSPLAEDHRLVEKLEQMARRGGPLSGIF